MSHQIEIQKTVPEIPIDQDKLISERKLAEILGWHPDTACVLRSRGTMPLPFIKIGRQVKYRLSIVEEYIRRNTIAGPRVDSTLKIG